jgi:DMSO/TMAO reductase YedYZ molybdopterin-dependent catalytic subunit
VQAALSPYSLASRRRFLGTAGAAALALSPRSALADVVIKLPLPGGPDERSITTAFPQKGPLILQRTRPPLLETPVEVFDQSVFTPNDRFYVRWHWSVIPTSIDVKSFRLAVNGHVNQSLSLSLDDLMTLPQMEIAVPAIRVAIFNRACLVRNGRTAPWGMRAGEVSASSTCSTAPG